MRDTQTFNGSIPMTDEVETNVQQALERLRDAQRKLASGDDLDLEGAHTDALNAATRIERAMGEESIAELEESLSDED